MNAGVLMAVLMAGLVTLILVLSVLCLLLLAAYGRMSRLNAELLEFLLEHRPARGEPFIIHAAREAGKARRPQA